MKRRKEHDDDPYIYKWLIATTYVTFTIDILFQESIVTINWGDMCQIPIRISALLINTFVMDRLYKTLVVAQALLQT